MDSYESWLYTREYRYNTSYMVASWLAQFVILIYKIDRYKLLW